MNIFQFKYSPIPKLALALLVFSLASFTKAAKSEIIVIDDFTTAMETTGIAVNYYVPNAQQGTQTSGYMYGNPISRDVDLTRVTNTDPTAFQRSTASINNDRFSWANDPGTASTTTINHQFSPVDIVSPQYGTSVGSVILDVTNVDLDAIATITLIDVNNQEATFSQSITTAGAQEVQFAYDDFLAVNSSLDLTQIKGITTHLSQEVGATAVDFEMDILAFSTPEPSSVMLFSLAGIGFASRRRRKRS